MSDMLRLTDDAIRLALTPVADVRAPEGLAQEIRTAIDASPQRRRGLFGWAPSRRTGLIFRLIVVGLLVLGAVAAILVVGSHRHTTFPPTTSTYRGGPERAGIMPGPGPVGTPGIEWQESANGPIGSWSPAVLDGAAYVGDQRGFVTAFDEATGAQRWQVNVVASVNSGVSVSDGLVVVGDDAGILHALDTTDGHSVWTYRAARSIHSTAAVVEGVAYFGDLDGYLYAVEMTTGDLRWPAAVQTAGPISRTIAVADGIIYAGSGGTTGSEGGTLGAYDAESGEELWRKPLQPGNTSTSVVADGRVFVSGGLDIGGATPHALNAFDAKTGQPAWDQPFTAPTGKIVFAGAVGDGLVFVEGTDGMLYLVDETTGSTAGSPIPIGSTQSPGAGLVGDVLYVTSDDRMIHAIDVASRSEIWSFLLDSSPGAPAVVDGRILVTTSIGGVISIARSTLATSSIPAP